MTLFKKYLSDFFIVLIVCEFLVLISVNPILVIVPNDLSTIHIAN